MAEARDPDARKEVLYRSYCIPLLIHCLACVKNSGTKIIPNPVLCEKKLWTKQSILGNSVTLILCGWKEEQFSRIARHPLVAWQHCCFQPLSVPWLTEDSGVHWIKSSSACCGVEVALFATQVLWWSSTVTFHPDCMIGYHSDHSPRLCDWVSQWPFTQTMIGYHGDHSPRLYDWVYNSHSPRLYDWVSLWYFTQIVWLSITVIIYSNCMIEHHNEHSPRLIEHDNDHLPRLFDWVWQRLGCPVVWLTITTIPRLVVVCLLAT